MSGWAVATGLAVWILILGSVAVFGWFLAEVARLARRRKRPPPDQPDGGDAPR